MGFPFRSASLSTSTRSGNQVQNPLIGLYRKHIEKKQREEEESFF